MKFKIYQEPFPHIIIENFFTKTEIKDIWKEIKLLTKSSVLLPPNKTLSARDNHGNFIKQNHGVFLDDLFASDRSKSSILTHYNKIFSKSIYDIVASANVFFHYLHFSRRDSTLLSYYENGDGYLSHRDDSSLTALVHFFHEPKKFKGGELCFDDYNLTYETEINRCIIFPGVVRHSVNTVSMSTSSSEGFSGNGRFTISKFIYY